MNTQPTNIGIHITSGMHTIGDDTARPVLVLLGAHSPSVAATLVVLVSDEVGVDIWVAIRVFISLICHSYSVSTTGQVLE